GLRDRHGPVLCVGEGGGLQSLSFERCDVAPFMFEAAAKRIWRRGSSKYGRLRLPMATAMSSAVRWRQLRKLDRSVADRSSSVSEICIDEQACLRPLRIDRTARPGSRGSGIALPSAAT